MGCCSSEEVCEGVLSSFDDVSGGDDDVVSDSSLVVGIGSLSSAALVVTGSSVGSIDDIGAMWMGKGKGKVKREVKCSSDGFKMTCCTKIEFKLKIAMSKAFASSRRNLPPAFDCLHNRSS